MAIQFSPHNQRFGCTLLLLAVDASGGCDSIGPEMEARRRKAARYQPHRRKLASMARALHFGRTQNQHANNKQAIYRRHQSTRHHRPPAARFCGTTSRLPNPLSQCHLTEIASMISWFARGFIAVLLFYLRSFEVPVNHALRCQIGQSVRKLCSGRPSRQ
jgi:hypothetical protein